jgi:hypothetical protein
MRRVRLLIYRRTSMTLERLPAKTVGERFAFRVRACSVLLTATAALACGSDPASLPAEGGSDGGASSLDADTSAACGPLASGTDLQGCIPKYCLCADGTTTLVGTGASFVNGACISKADTCGGSCAEHGGSGIGLTAGQVYATAECRAYCGKLVALPCSSSPSALASIRLAVSRKCSFEPPTADGSAQGACETATKAFLACLVDSAAFACTADGNGFFYPTVCQSEQDAVAHCGRVIDAGAD